jgi:4-amino-4-deoxy-L-arabinose transferase-like glycosyltransferase
VTSDRRLYLTTLLGLTALHVLLAAVIPVSGDEAYYWDCSRHPDWSYFDQPPLVIWAMVPFRAVLGETALAVRGPALLASLLIGVFLLPLVRRLGGGPRQAAGVYLLMHAMPMFLLGSFYTSTDVAMIAAFLGATWAAVALAQGEQRAWYGFAVALGLGFLAKFPAVLVLPALLPTLLARREGRRFAVLATPHPYLAGGISLLLTLPVWVWAIQHGYDNIEFQLVSRHGGGPLTLTYLGEFLGASLLLASPFLAVGQGIAGWRRWRAADPAWRALLLAAASPVAFFALTSLRTRVGAHWGGPGLTIAVVALTLTAFRGRRTLIALGAAFGLLLSSTVLAIVLAPGPLLGVEWSYRGRPKRVSTRKLSALVGNERILAEARARLAPNELVSSESYTTVHLLAFLSGGSLETRLANVKGGKHGFASLYWYPPEELRGRDVLFVTDKREVDERLRTVFAEVTEDPPLEIDLEGRVVRRVRFLRCRDMQHPESVFTRLGRPLPQPWIEE